MNEICFGPFITKSRGPAFPSKELQPANLAIEFSTVNGGYSMALYFKHDHSDPFLRHWHIGLRHFYIERSQLCREVGYSLLFQRAFGGQNFLPLDQVLLPLYRKFPFQTKFLDLLTELREAFGNPLDFPWTHSNHLGEKATGRGFRTSRIFNYGRKMHVDIEWAPPIDHGKPSPVSASLAHVVFIPGPGRTLGPGKWAQFRKGSDDHTALLLRPALNKIGSPPIKLFSPAGIEKLLADFKWTPASLLPRAELDTARQEFIQAHPELWTDVTALAKALLAQGLYSKTTDLSALKKRLRTHVPSN